MSISPSSTGATASRGWAMSGRRSTPGRIDARSPETDARRESGDRPLRRRGGGPGEQVCLRSSPAIQVVLRVGVGAEEGLEPPAQLVADRVAARLAVQVHLLARVGLQVVELERAVGVPV